MMTIHRLRPQSRNAVPHTMPISVVTTLHEHHQHGMHAALADRAGQPVDQESAIQDLLRYRGRQRQYQRHAERGGQISPNAVVARQVRLRQIEDRRQERRHDGLGRDEGDEDSHDP